jgi:hypothetical protein
LTAGDVTKQNKVLKMNAGEVLVHLCFRIDKNKYDRLNANDNRSS